MDENLLQFHFQIHPWIPIVNGVNQEDGKIKVKKGKDNKMKGEKDEEKKMEGNKDGKKNETSAEKIFGLHSKELTRPDGR